MTNKMTDEASDNKDCGALLRVLTAHYHSLVAAGSDEIILKRYAALLHFLKSGNTQFLGKSFGSKQRSDTRKILPTFSDEELRRASLDDIDKFVSDEQTTRRDLEYIAIQRFSVPRGSMRSFSNKQMLVDKLRTLIRNERTHETIGAVARGQVKQVPDS